MTTDYNTAIRHKLVDDREPRLIKEKLLELGWEQKRMYSADYLFYTHNMKKVGVERKSIDDLVSSLGDRMSSELINLTEYCDYCILLVEGSWKMVLGKIMSNRGVESYLWSTIWNYIRSWQDYKITLELTTDEGHTIRRLNELYAYYQDPNHTGGINKKTFSDRRIMALQCGGIGEKLGQALLDKFGTIRNIANATVQDYLTVEKIGQAKAEALYAHFNKDGRGVNNDQL